MDNEFENLLKEYSVDNNEFFSEQKKTILIVDDEVRICSSLQNIFANDFNVIYALSGIEALDIINQDVYCVIMDAKMEGMNGFETTNEIRRLYKNIPIIMHTAYHSEHSTSDVVDCHFYGYIEKGNINGRDLRKIVKQACDSYTLFLENEQYKRNLQNKIFELDKTYAALELQRKSEKKLERVMTGGFAHEIRNALTGGMFELSTVLESDGDTSTIEKIQTNLINIFELILSIESTYSVPKEIINEIASSSFCKISDHLSQLDKILKALNKDIGRGLYLAKQILDYSKLQDLKRGTETVNITELIIGILEKAKIRDPDVLQDLAVTLENGENFIVGSSSQLESMIQNIILNAYDAVRDSTIKNIFITLCSIWKNEIKYLVIDIKDSGNGIAEKYLDFIFDPFFTKKYSSGTGLGLSVTKRMVELYEGTIEVESVVGNGAGFKLYLKTE